MTNPISENVADGRMTNPIPLTSERLDELGADAAQYINEAFVDIDGGWSCFTFGELRALIAMAKRTDAAERELVIANERVRAYQISSETMGELADKLGRERDALRLLLEQLTDCDVEVRSGAALAEHGGDA